MLPRHAADPLRSRAMRRGWLACVVAMGVFGGCGDDAPPTASGTTGTGPGESSSSGGSTTMPADSSGATTTIAGSEGSSTAATDGGPKLDLGLQPDIGGTTMEPIPTTCAAAASGATSVGCEF